MSSVWASTSHSRTPSPAVVGAAGAGLGAAATRRQLRLIGADVGCEELRPHDAALVGGGAEHQLVADRSLLRQAAGQERMRQGRAAVVGQRAEARIGVGLVARLAQPAGVGALEVAPERGD